MSANTYRGRYWDAISLAIYNKYGEIENLFLDNWGNPLMLPSGNKLVNKQGYFIVLNKEGETLHEEKIPQTAGVDAKDRVNMALSLIKNY